MTKRQHQQQLFAAGCTVPGQHPAQLHCTGKPSKLHPPPNLPGSWHTCAAWPSHIMHAICMECLRFTDHVLPTYTCSSTLCVSSPRVSSPRAHLTNHPHCTRCTLAGAPSPCWLHRPVLRAAMHMAPLPSPDLHACTARATYLHAMSLGAMSCLACSTLLYKRAAMLQTPLWLFPMQSHYSGLPKRWQRYCSCLTCFCCCCACCCRCTLL